jgi:hypothetical protein
MLPSLHFPLPIQVAQVTFAPVKRLQYESGMQFPVQSITPLAPGSESKKKKFVQAAPGWALTLWTLSQRTRVEIEKNKTPKSFILLAPLELSLNESKMLTFKTSTFY